MSKRLIIGAVVGLTVAGAIAGLVKLRKESVKTREEMRRAQVSLEYHKIDRTRIRASGVFRAPSRPPPIGPPGQALVDVLRRGYYSADLGKRRQAISRMGMQIPSGAMHLTGSRPPPGWDPLKHAVVGQTPPPAGKTAEDVRRERLYARGSAAAARSPYTATSGGAGGMLERGTPLPRKSNAQLAAEVAAASAQPIVATAAAGAAAKAAMSPATAASRARFEAGKQSVASRHAGEQLGRVRGKVVMVGERDVATVDTSASGPMARERANKHIASVRRSARVARAAGAATGAVANAGAAVGNFIGLVSDDTRQSVNKLAGDVKTATKATSVLVEASHKVRQEAAAGMGGGGGGGPMGPKKLGWWARKKQSWRNRAGKAVFGEGGTLGRMFGERDPGGGMTFEQRNAVLVNRSFTSMSQGARELRLWIKQIHGMFRKPVRANVKPAQTALKGLAKTASAASKTVKSSVGSLNTVLMSVGGGLMAGGGIYGAKSLIGGMIAQASQFEDARVTFDVMLGDAQKSEKLMQGITEYAAKTPFQQQDLIAGSKALLSITKTDVEYNQDLLKLAGQMAALKPGTSVEDAAMAITRGAYGEGESLKQFFVQAPVSKIRELSGSDIGTDEYNKALISEISRQMVGLTGGRDLVEVLGKTLTGRTSTMTDNFKLIGLTIGQSILSVFGADLAMESAIAFGDKLRSAFNYVFKGEDLIAGAGSLVEVAKGIKDALMWMVPVKEAVVDAFSWLWGKWESLSPGMRKTIVKIGLIVVGAVSAIGILLPALIAVVGVLSMGWEIILGSIAGIAYYAALAAAAVGLTWLGLKGASQEGEHLQDTIVRIGTWVWDKIVYGWQIVSAIVGNIWQQLGPVLMPILSEFAGHMHTIWQRFTFVLSVLTGGESSLGTWQTIGYRIGRLFAMIAKVVGWVVNGVMSIAAWMADFIAPTMRQWVADVRHVWGTFQELLGGKTTFLEFFKTLGKGMLDLILFPFQRALAVVLANVGLVMSEWAVRIRPFSDTLADAIGAGGTKMNDLAVQMRDGFLESIEDFRTDIPITVEVRGKMEAPVTVKLDGKKVGEGLATAEMRGRNSGRGGDPLNPDEIGYVINNGVIRQVSLSEVAA